jgi:hypothetical protein
VATSGAQPGNQNAAKARRWREAIERALSRATGNIDAGLDKIADKLVAAAIDGDQWATEHIANRFDGKPTEHREVTKTVHLTDESRSSKLRDQLRAARSAPPVGRTLQ